MQPNLIRPPVAADGDFFMVLVGIGTPSQGTYLHLDIGSSLIWTQCANCRKCFPQKFPKYDSKKSRSYTKVPANHFLCRPPGLHRSSGNECVYNLSYTDGSWARGIASLDTFNFLNRDKTPESIPNVMFGCTTESRFMAFGPDREISGILGMGKSNDSLISQIKIQVGGRFSYCLFFNAWTRTNATSFLRFGTDIPGSQNFQRTRLVPHPAHPESYALNLRDISIGDHRMNFPANTFAVTGNDSRGGFILDTGTLVSYIDRNPYSQIRRVFVERFNRLRLQQSRHNKFDLCYTMPRNVRAQDVFTPMTYHFEGGSNLWVASENVFLVNRIKNFFCLGLKPQDGMTVLGALQQQNTRFIYDVHGGVLSFARENCAANDNI
ncbi:hypothetical protein Acr_00g0005830 [Actinidia rufa]|uniref:Peptidase A1 domain-containing protein n=1 Tax=Actinidia rufa TaxID=165716 RepID=A0A7J0D9N3_9ERIC|nr:hypothetical protein Acr_00g0005830 [Actinidia rufa]